MTSPRFSAAHAEDLRSRRENADPKPSLAKKVARFHNLGRRLKEVYPIAGRYRPSMVITGGMSVLYLAKDIVTRRPVVVKMARSSSNGITPEISAKAIRREGRALSRIKHDNVVRLLAKGTSDGSKFVVLDYVRGTDLHYVLDKEKRLPWGRLRGIALQICDALQASHDSNTVHSDVKPENIILSADGSKATLLDFGLARSLSRSSETRSEDLLGTLDYMAPEDLDSSEYDHRIDVYGLGVVMYELLVGWNPFFVDENNLEIIRRVLRHVPPPPSFWMDCSPGLDAIVMRAIAKDPDDRFQTMTEMRRAIESARP